MSVNHIQIQISNSAASLCLHSSEVGSILRYVVGGWVGGGGGPNAQFLAIMTVDDHMLIV